jgi:hypothetical protein
MSKQRYKIFAAITLTLSDEEANAYTREIEAVQPCLHVQPNMLSVPTPLPLEDTLGDGGNGRVVPAFDVIENLCETFIVILDLGRPLNVVGTCKVSCFMTSEQKKKKERNRINAPPFHWNPQLEVVEPVPVRWTSITEIVGVGVRIVWVGFGFGEGDIVRTGHHECLADIGWDDDRRERD